MVSAVAWHGFDAVDRCLKNCGNKQPAPVTTLAQLRAVSACALSHTPPAPRCMVCPSCAHRLNRDNHALHPAAVLSATSDQVEVAVALQVGACGVAVTSTWLSCCVASGWRCEAAVLSNA